MSGTQQRKSRTATTRQIVDQYMALLERRGIPEPELAEHQRAWLRDVCTTGILMGLREAMHLGKRLDAQTCHLIDVIAALEGITVPSAYGPRDLPMGPKPHKSAVLDRVAPATPETMADAFGAAPSSASHAPGAEPES